MTDAKLADRLERDALGWMKDKAPAIDLSVDQWRTIIAALRQSEQNAAGQVRVVGAAVLTDDGVIHFMPIPHRHHDTVHALHRDRTAEAGVIVARGKQGFVLSDGTFADRIAAVKVATDSGQLTKPLHSPPNLYSEDLW